MTRRLLLEEEVGSSSAFSSCSDKPPTESREAQNTTAAPSQQSITAKVRHLELHEPNRTCGQAKLWNLQWTFFCKPNQQVTSQTANQTRCPTPLFSSEPHHSFYNGTLLLTCYSFHVKAKTERNGDSSSSNNHRGRLVNGNTATEFNAVT